MTRRAVASASVPASGLFAMAERCLYADAPDRKLALTQTAQRRWRLGRLVIESAPGAPSGMERAPGRPAVPILVPPSQVPRRGMGTDEGRGALLHALAHIEFNAINLAWDAVYRFRGFERAFYDDWISVAAEEAEHFCLLRAHLGRYVYGYGDFPAHNGLWQMAIDTAQDPLHRLALVPRVLEARGLDVTPEIIEKFRRVRDWDAVEILKRIQRDEEGHVAIGTRWFRALCAKRGIDPEVTFLELVARFSPRQIKAPFSVGARARAGFGPVEMAGLRRLTEPQPTADRSAPGDDPGGSG